MKIRIILILYFISQAVHSDGVSQVLQTKLNQIRTMSASFTQVIQTKRGRTVKSSGAMALSRPGHFRWQTYSPMAQLIVADGKRLWVYDKDLEQVTVKRQARGVGGTAGLFLSGYSRTVTNHFHVTMAKQGTREIYDLRPKSGGAQVQHVTLTFEGPALVGIQLYDQLGQRSNVQLSRVKTNGALPLSLFQFRAPKGVDVVQQ